MILIIDACTERGVVALAQGSAIVTKEELSFGYNNSKNLMPAIERVLGGKKPESIVLGVGPGSYTGIRIGATAAKTLSFVWGIPIYPVSTLLGFDAIPLIDAKISGVYLQLEGEGPRVASLDALLDLCPEGKTFCTPNAKRIREKIEQLYPDRWRWLEQAPDPLKLLNAAEKDKPKNHNEIELLYLRKTQAELERNANDMVNR